MWKYFLAHIMLFIPIWIFLVGLAVTKDQSIRINFVHNWASRRLSQGFDYVAAQSTYPRVKDSKPKLQKQRSLFAS